MIRNQVFVGHEFLNVLKAQLTLAVAVAKMEIRKHRVKKLELKNPSYEKPVLRPLMTSQT